MDEAIKNARILIVDDSAEAIQLLKILLMRAGYTQVRGLTEAQQIRDIYNDWLPDLILLDLMMPNFDGFAVMETLRALSPSDMCSPILVITADVTPDTRQRALEVGASDFVTKPYDNAEVVLRVRNLLNTRLLTQALRASRKQAQALSQRLINAQEEERQNLARELHDEIGQALTVVKINLQTLRRALRLPHTLEDNEDHINHSIDVVEHALSQVRELSLDLRPAMLDDFGLVETLAWYVNHQAQIAGIEGQFFYDNLPCRQSSALETTCFRVVQEALTNVMRHAQAKSVCVELRCSEPDLRLTVQDDGKGFDVEQNLEQAQGDKMGLLGLRERVKLSGGVLKVISSPNQGTRIEAILPVTVLQKD